MISQSDEIEFDSHAMVMGHPTQVIGLQSVSCHVKSGPPIFSSPGPNISKYLDPRIIYFNFVEIFGHPGTKISDIFGPL